MSVPTFDLDWMLQNVNVSLAPSVLSGGVVTRGMNTDPSRTLDPVFALAQESSRQVKAWYESSDRIR
jgi:hypothetical protein